MLFPHSFFSQKKTRILKFSIKLNIVVFLCAILYSIELVVVYPFSLNKKYCLVSILFQIFKED